MYRCSDLFPKLLLPKHFAKKRTHSIHSEILHCHDLKVNFHDFDKTLAKRSLEHVLRAKNNPKFQMINQKFKDYYVNESGYSHNIEIFHEKTQIHFHANCFNMSLEECLNGLTEFSLTGLNISYLYKSALVTRLSSHCRLRTFAQLDRAEHT